METISVKLPAWLRRRLTDEAKRRNVSQSAIVRELIEHGLEETSQRQRPTSCADLIRDRIGTVRSGRRDLATNEALLAEAVLEDSRRAPERRR